MSYKVEKEHIGKFESTVIRRMTEEEAIADTELQLKLLNDAIKSIENLGMMANDEEIRKALDILVLKRYRVEKALNEAKSRKQEFKK